MTRFLCSLALLIGIAVAPCAAAGAKGGSFGGGKSGGTSAGGTTTSSAAIGRKRKPDQKLFTFTTHAQLSGKKAENGGGVANGGSSGGSNSGGKSGDAAIGFGRPLKPQHRRVLKPLPQ